MLKDFTNLDYSQKDMIPNIDLYMDQLIAFIEEYLCEFKRNEDETILTKTMINNYVKSKLIDPPSKKKYDKDQLKKLMVIYKMKNILSIKDIKKYFDSLENIEIDEIFDTYESIEKKAIDSLNLGDLKNDKERVDKILNLVIDSDVRKRAAEMILDSIKIKK